MIFSFQESAAIGLALVLALVATPVVREFARRGGAVARPRADRWHKKPTALLGGIAIFVAVIVPYLALLPKTPQTQALVCAASLMWLLGLVDDLRPMKPYKKLIGQVMAAAVVVYYDLSLPWTPSPLVNTAITIFWLVGITNAVNLLDNMDGLAAGIGAIAAFFLGLNFLNSGQVSEAALLGTFGASLLGFLVYNSNPASIFMGDSGSLFVGFFLASIALLSMSGGRSRGFVPVLTVPVMTLFIPIFDTTLVTILRKLAGRAVSRGGRDHASHRLVSLGISERLAVLMLYALAATAGLVAVLASTLPLDMSLAIIAAFTLALTFAGVFLARVKVYDEDQLSGLSHMPVMGFLINFSYKRRMFEVLLDVVLIILSYYLAYTLLYGSIEDNGQWDRFIDTLAVLLFIKMATFPAMGVYRGLWRYISLDSLIVYAKAVLVSSVICMVFLLFLMRFEGYSRKVFVLDGLIMFLFLTGTRLTFRVGRKLLPPLPGQSVRRVLVYGAGDVGVLLVRLLRNDRHLCQVPVGFADDDPAMKGRVVHGLRVFGGNGSLPSICKQQRIDSVCIAGDSLGEQRVEEIRQLCMSAGVAIHRMRIVIEPVIEPTVMAVRRREVEQ